MHGRALRTIRLAAPEGGADRHSDCNADGKPYTHVPCDNPENRSQCCS